MLTALQKYMRNYNSLEKLTEEYAIKTYEHPVLNLVGFKYNQINSPRFNNIVRFSRGTVLERGTWNLVAQGFKRFYNYDEFEEDREKFNWNCFSSTEKCDGSIIFLYNYKGQWLINTSGSFGEGNVGFSNFTWSELFWNTLKKDKEVFLNSLNPNCCYIFELCTLFNKIVRSYPEPSVFLLSITERINGELKYEWTCGEIKFEANRLKLRIPEVFNFKAIDEILIYLKGLESSDPSNEGVVVRDNQNIRFKIKSESYLRLHHMFDNGNVANPKYFVPFILKGEKEEVLSYFNELRSILDEAERKIQKEWDNLLDIWKKYSKLESQKEFACSIVGKTKFTSILFTLRKNLGTNQTQDDLQTLWVSSHDLITKVIYG
jgi:hypothetical protein